MAKKYLSNRSLKGSIAALVLIGLIGFTASHAYVNSNDEEEHGDDRIIVKIIKIEDGDTTIIEQEFDDISEFHALKHHLNGQGGAKSGVHYQLSHSNTDEEEETNIKIKVVDYGSDSGNSIHKKIIICSNEDTLEHEDIHINLKEIHREMAEAMEELDIEVSFDENWVKNLHSIMEEFEMDIDIKSNEEDEKMEILIKSFSDEEKLKKLIEHFHAQNDAI